MTWVAHIGCAARLAAADATIRCQGVICKGAGSSERQRGIHRSPKFARLWVRVEGMPTPASALPGSLAVTT